MGSILPGGWPEVMRRNHELAVEGRALLCGELGLSVPCPGVLLGSMASLPLPAMPRFPELAAGGAFRTDPVQDALLSEGGIEVPVFSGPAHAGRMVRISCQLYNELADFGRLARELARLAGG